MKTLFRVSAKALVVRDGKILLAQEHDGRWELPGGGIDFGEDPAQTLLRELKEECGLTGEILRPQPIYTWTMYQPERSTQVGRLLLGYHVELDSLDFTPSDECTALEFHDKASAATLTLHENFQDLFKFFDPADFPEDAR